MILPLTLQNPTAPHFHSKIRLNFGQNYDYEDECDAHKVKSVSTQQLQAVFNGDKQANRWMSFMWRRLPEIPRTVNLTLSVAHFSHAPAHSGSLDELQAVAEYTKEQSGSEMRSRRKRCSWLQCLHASHTKRAALNWGAMNTNGRNSYRRFWRKTDLVWTIGRDRHNEKKFES